jgi:hypothetical protein
MKLGEVENRETETWIDPCILAREIREMTRKSNKAGEEKMKLGKVEIVQLRSESNLKPYPLKLSKHREIREMTRKKIRT